MYSSKINKYFGTIHLKICFADFIIIKIYIMGPISPYGPKEFGRLTEEDILNQSENFIKEQELCLPTDPCFQVVRLVIAKINIYGHRHLLDHLRMFQEKNTKLRFLQQWKTLNFQNLDLLFQNLIRRKIMRVEEEQIFTKTQLHQKYSFAIRQKLKSLYNRGEQLITSKKTAVIIFVGSSATICQQIFEKQFHKQQETDQCLFAIIMKRLQEIADKYGLPPTYIFYNVKNSEKVNKFLKTYKYGGDPKIRCCLQGNHPILNLNGNICLARKQQGKIIEMPNGPADFYHYNISGVSILNKLKQDKIQYVSCCDCQNMLQMVIDPYVLGLLDSKKSEFDLMYKCTYPENQKDRTFRRVVMQNGVPKTDSVQNLSSFINYNSKYRVQNNEIIMQSPVWMNSLIFNVDRVAEVLNSAQKMTTFPQTVNYKMKTMSYWSPIDFQQHQNQSCYVFEKELSDLFMNHLFKSKAIMVDREEEYLPVITQKKQYNWRNGYKQYLKKIDSGWSKPFYQKFQHQEVHESGFKPESTTSGEKHQQVQYELLKKGREETK